MFWLGRSLTAVTGWSVILFLASAILPQASPMREEDAISSFFLKASKSVPRVGRSFREDSVQSFFLKPPKSIPRMGKKDENMEPQNQIYSDQISPVALRRRYDADNDYEGRPSEVYADLSNSDDADYNMEPNAYSRQKRDANYKELSNFERAIPNYQQTSK